MDFRILYLLLLTLNTSMKYGQCCDIRELQCTYIVACSSEVDLSDYHQFTNPPNWDHTCQVAVTYKEQKYYNVELAYYQFSLEHDITLVPELGYSLFDYPDDSYYILNIISSLDLSHHRFDNTPVIRSMQNLALINLSRNQLTTAILSNEHQLSMLTKIDLSHNMIKNILINKNKYPYNKLTYIDMSHNLLNQIPDSIFSGFKYLQTLNVSYNYIKNLNELTFKGASNITDLDISNNRLTSINSSLVNLSQLITLNLSGNDIENILPNEFDLLFKLEILDLSYNSMRKLNTSLLRKVSRLKDINLSNNLLETIDTDLFSNLQLLYSVDISKNKLKLLPVGTFQNTISNFVINDNRLQGALVKGMLDKVNVVKLNFSHQCLTEIKDYAFYNITELKELLLNSNNIKTLSNKSLSTLVNLEILNLSNNQISDLTFEKKDLSNLQTLLLENNRLIEINYEHFQHLIAMKYLNLSGNLISQLGFNTFRILGNLIEFDISNNSLVGTLETKAFDGLDSVPYLDISRSKLNAIQNASFNDMTELKELNISYCLISDLQYNAFINTGSINTLDLSFNKLQDFTVNATHLVSLMTLLLNNNLIKTISSNSFCSLSLLNEINLSHNVIQHFISSHNSTVLENTYSNISGSLGTDNSMQAYLDLVALKSLDLSHNNISSLQVGYFSGLDALTMLDLSFNEISYVEPGAFKNNLNLISLNLSHNFLQSVNYGMFRGLSNVIVLNMSYNELKELDVDSFIDVSRLSELIVDFNLIQSIDFELIQLDTLSKLSIGDNPLPCKNVAQYERKGSGKITAIRLNENNNENVYGIVCNKARDTANSVSDHIGGNDIIINKLSFNLSQLYKRNYDILENISSIFEQFNEKLINSTNFSKPAFSNNFQSQPSSSYSYNDTKSIIYLLATCVALIVIILVAFVFYKVFKYRLMVKNQCTYRIHEFSGGIENSVL